MGVVEFWISQGDKNFKMGATTYNNQIEIIVLNGVIKSKHGILTKGIIYHQIFHGRNIFTIKAILSIIGINN
jgi:hypothetical protein